ncbi:MerR family transcriptional regulator [Actinomadura sp. ATCC 31491]|uniref:MerR family transcriptional regulator n=1 Tax=Actinomadura luzonensis TaxID=2805427 RepID=A0ABT0FXS4_9ACTN|nr:MerR family transcriptional regulator [Actinomadura luzonensis]MCK2217105.1 MerR family transcriptional regulator [Actinomadura luzonensis]
MKSNAVMAIGDVAARFGLAPHVLRHWEAMGLLAPARAEGDRRRYSRDDLYRIALILRAREAGIGLEDLRRMLTTTDPAARREILQRHRAGLLQRIAAAQASLDLLNCALTCDHEDFSSCRSFQAMLTERVEQARPSRHADGPVDRRQGRR